MSAFTPCFPPLILEKCLDLAMYVAQEKIGKATLEVNLGSSRFNFSIDHSSSQSIQTGPTSQAPVQKTRKKSPSDHRRSALRLKNFLEMKRTSLHQPEAPSKPSIDSSNISETSEAPLIDSEDVEHVMDTDPGIQVDIEESVAENVLENESRNKTEANFNPAITEVEINQPERLSLIHI